MSRAKLAVNHRPTADPAETAQLVVFRLDAQRYALPLASVERIVRAVAVTALPKAPPVVLGIINLAGSVIPVFSLRRRFGLPERPVAPADHFAIALVDNATSHRKRVALSIDAAENVIERPCAEIVQAAAISPGLDHIQGAIQLDDGLVLIQDLNRFLSLDEARALDEALHRETIREV